MHEQVVTKIHVGLVLSQRIQTDLCGRQHDLNTVAGAIHQGCEAELATVASKHHTTGNTDLVLSFFADFKVSVLFTNIGNRSGNC